ncbi:MAG: CoA ester lyase [Lachnospiraceae bacterium]|nr:CoA ester lyase [Lachnospiraceae bacterium]
MISNNCVARGLLFVPSYDKYLKKIEKMDAEAIIIDLEDSVAQEDKEAALTHCIEFLSNYDNRINIYVRLNFDRAEYEISKLQDFNVRGFVFPKLESADDIPAICSKDIIGLIETPMGVVNVDKYIADQRITAIAFGAEDYSSISECANEETSLLYAKSRLVTYAKAYGKMIYDTVYTDVHNNEGFKNAAISSKKLGFDGKMLIHPSQVDLLREVYDDLDYNLIEEIIKKYNECDSGVLYMNDRIYERPHIEYYKKKLEAKRKGCLDE